jgi:hypothetical protein
MDRLLKPWHALLLWIPLAHAEPQVEASAGYQRFGDFHFPTLSVSGSMTADDGKTLSGNLSMSFLAEQSVPRTLSNQMTTAHLNATSAPRRAGPLQAQVGISAAREIYWESRSMTAGPLLQLTLEGRVPVVVHTRMDLGKIGILGGAGGETGENSRNSTPYAGIAADVYVSPLKSLTVFSQSRVGLTEEGFRAQVSGLIWSLEALNRKIPLTLSIARVSDRQRRLRPTHHWNASIMFRLRRFEAAK